MMPAARVPDARMPGGRARLRRRIEDAIEALIDLLDELDGDPDAEDGDVGEDADAEPREVAA